MELTLTADEAMAMAEQCQGVAAHRHQEMFLVLDSLGRRPQECDSDSDVQFAYDLGCFHGMSDVATAHQRASRDNYRLARELAGVEGPD